MSWHITAVSGGILAGCLLALGKEAYVFSSAAWLLAVVILFSVAAIKRFRFLLLAAVAAGLVLGLWRGSNEQIKLAEYRGYYNQQVTISGRAAEDSSRAEHGGGQNLRLTSVKINQRPMSGQAWLSLAKAKPIRRGGLVVASGKLKEGFGNLPASMSSGHLEAVHYAKFGDVGETVRSWFAAKIRLAIPEPQASLGIGYTLGQGSGLPVELSDQFRALGLTHLLVASGTQLTLLVAFVKKPLSGRSKYLSCFLSMALVGGFLLLTGFTASMVRAGLVSVLSLLAWYYGRAIHPVVLLLFVAGLTVLAQPSMIWGDVGWLLSFAAFAGIVLLAPLINGYFWGNEGGMLRNLLLACVAAQLLTFPVIAYYFGQYSPLSVLANLLVQPVVSIIMLFVFIGGVAGAVVPALASSLSAPAYILLLYTTKVVGFMSDSPLASKEINFGAKYVLASYALMLVSIGFMWSKTGHNFRAETSVQS